MAVWPSRNYFNHLIGGCSRIRTCDPLIKSPATRVDFMAIFSQPGRKAADTEQWVALLFPTEKEPDEAAEFIILMLGFGAGFAAMGLPPRRPSAMSERV